VDSEATNQLSSLHFRARLPKYFRAGAIIFFALTVIVVGIGYYRARSNTDFRMKAFPTALSKDVVALVSGYERRESEGDVPKYFIKADTATTFSDNHQELENVYLQVFGEENVSDEITAEKAIYIPEENKNFTGYFAGNVLIKTRDSLSLRTQQVTYKKVDETAIADEHVEFERFNIKGSSFGASLNIKTKSVTLDRDVNVEVIREDGETAGPCLLANPERQRGGSYTALTTQANLPNSPGSRGMRRGWSWRAPPGAACIAPTRGSRSCAVRRQPTRPSAGGASRGEPPCASTQSRTTCSASTGPS